MYGRTNLGKTIGAAATPFTPAPLNTPSLKKENNGRDISTNIVSTSSSSGVWGSHQSSLDGRGMDEANRPVAAKPAPWAKASTSAAVATTDTPHVSTVNTTASTRPQLKTWAAEDEDEEDEERESPAQPAPAAYWPDNFRDNAAEEAPEVNERGSGHSQGFARFHGDNYRVSSKCLFVNVGTCFPSFVALLSILFNVSLFLIVVYFVFA